MNWHRAAMFDALEEGGVIGVDIDGTPVALYRLDGRVYATHNVCTHQFALLSDGYLEDGCIECPLHQGRFDVRTGKALCAPVSEGLRTYAVRVEDGVIFVSLDAPAPAAAASADSARRSSEAGGERVVILGAGQAGGRAAEALRAAGFAGEVVLVGEEPVPPYERPPLSKEILTGKAGVESCTLLKEARWRELDILLRLSTRAERIDTTAHVVALSDGSMLPYDKLLIATGARARRLAVPGADLPSVHYLRTQTDGLGLRDTLRSGGRLVVIGGGFIGLEVASSACDLGCAVTVVEQEARILDRILPAAAGDVIAERAAAAGIRLLTGARVTALEGTAAVEAVRLADGRRLEADIVVIGIGVIPNEELAVEAGIAAADGILVDEYGRTSAPDVFAAGDVAVYPHLVRGRRLRLESWHNAQEQAIAAARSMAGHLVPYRTTPWFWSDQFGANLQMIGLPQRTDPVVCRSDLGGSSALFFMSESRLTGVIAFDDPEAIRLGRRLIESGAAVDPVRLAEFRVTSAAPTHAAPNMGLEPKGRGGKAMISLQKPADRRNDGRSPSQTYVWPEEGLVRVPDWVYTDEEIYRREVERIFHGRTWNYVALEAEIPNSGDFTRSFLGPTPIVVTRAEDGSIHAFENRCAHRAAEFCRSLRGNAKEFVCPYHQWSYDLRGNLVGVPFRRGVDNKGGMPKDFSTADHGLRKLTVTTRRGVVFASYAEDMEPLEDYLGPDILREFDTTFDGRKLKVLGYYRNTVPGNWKLYHENLKDPYHATLLHTFLVTFGLLVAGNKSAMMCDATGRHGVMASAKSEGGGVDADRRKEMRAYREGMTLKEPRLIDYVEEFDSPWSVTMQTIWPNLIVQRELNTLGVRQIVPQGPNSFIMNWTMFGFEGDSDEMIRHRLRQGNLMGPAGFLGLEDNEAMKFVQDGMLRCPEGRHLVALDPDTEAGSSDTLISEAAIRAMYKHWRQELGL